MPVIVVLTSNLSESQRRMGLVRWFPSQFYDLHVDYPADFGLFMINLGRELSREISMLEDVIGKSTGWLIEE